MSQPGFPAAETNLPLVGDDGPPRHGDDCCRSGHPPTNRDERWLRAARRARALSWFSLAWMSVEGILGLVAGISSGSIALVGWALGSVIEGLASAIVVWRFTGDRTMSETAERRAQKGVAFSFFLLAPYIAVEAVRDIVTGHLSQPSTLGVIVTAVSVIVMPLLGRAKHRLGEHLESEATAGEGTQNLMCAAQAAAVLLGLGFTAVFGWSWVDPIIGLALAGWAIYEGVEGWKGNACC